MSSLFGIAKVNSIDSIYWKKKKNQFYQDKSKCKNMSY